jgi:hypothetical protein
MSKIDAKSGELLLYVARTHASDKSPTRQMVEAHQRLRSEKGMTGSQYVYIRHESNVRGMAGHESQGGNRIGPVCPHSGGA